MLIANKGKMGKYAQRDERKMCWKLLRSYLLKVYLKKKQYIIKMLKKSKSIKKEEIKIKRVAKFDRLLANVKRVTKDVVDGCVFGLLETEFGVEFDKLATNQLIEGSQLTIEDLERVKQRNGESEKSRQILDLIAKWRDDIGTGKIKELVELSSKIKEKAKIWGIKERKRSERRERRRQQYKEKLERGERETPSEKEGEDKPKAEENEDEQMEDENEEGESGPGEHGKPKSSEEDSDGDVKIEFEDQIDKKAEMDEKKEPNEGKPTKKQVLEKRKKNQFTTEFIYEMEKQVKREKASKLVDKFFVTEEELSKVERGSGKREFILGKKQSKEFRLSGFDPTKMKQTRRKFGKRQPFRRNPNAASGGVANKRKTIQKGPRKFATRQMKAPSRQVHSKQEHHPSYHLKMLKRKKEREGKFQGKIIDL